MVKLSSCSYLKLFLSLIPASALTMAISTSAVANPQGGVVIEGSANISTPNPLQTTINQHSQSAIIEWQSFDIDVGETTTFVQPNSEAWALNRVTGSMNPSEILGTLEANGNVIISNPDGIHFGSGAKVDVNRLIATTADVSNQDFMSGNLNFSVNGNVSASIVNEGSISIADYGLAAFVAPSVRNSGVITARLGNVALAAGNTFSVDPYGDGLITLVLHDEIADEVFDVATGDSVKDLVANEGTISANGGTVAMTAATARSAVNSVVNNSGVLEANSVGVQNGKIILGGQTKSSKAESAPTQVVAVSGKLDASSTVDKGGKIQVTGEALVFAGADIDASGATGGGTILLGGDYLGGSKEASRILQFGAELEDEKIPTSEAVFLDSNTKINADANDNGKGGKVIVWSDGSTVTDATITARGGQNGGDGGFVETSGKRLNAMKAADVSSAHGNAGTWVLDPENIIIRDGELENYTFDGPFEFDLSNYAFTVSDLITGGPYFGFGFYPDGTDTSIIATEVIETALNGGTSVEISNAFEAFNGDSISSGSGSITIEDSIEKTSGGDVILVFTAYGDIRIDSGVDFTSNSGKLYLSFLSYSDDILASNIGDVDLNGGGLGLWAADTIRVTSNSNMPDLAIITDFWDQGDENASVDVEFGDDKIDFRYTETTAEFEEGAIELLEGSNYPSVYIYVNDRDLILSNGSIVRDDNAEWNIYGVNSVGAKVSDAFDGIPEIVWEVGTTTWTVFNDAPSGSIGLLEGSGDNGRSITEYFATSPVGELLLESLNADDGVTDKNAPEILEPIDENDERIVLQEQQDSEPFERSPDPLTLEDFEPKIDNFGKWLNSNDPVHSDELIQSLEPFILAAYSAYPGNKNLVDLEMTWFRWAVKSGLSQLDIQAMIDIGFDASVYMVDGQPILAISGSDQPIDYIYTNIPNAVTSTDDEPMYLFAESMLRSLKLEYPNIMVTGHSLGGSIAAYIGAKTNTPAVALDPAGINSNDKNYQRGQNNILNLIVEGGGVQNFSPNQGKTVVLDQNVWTKSGKEIPPKINPSRFEYLHSVDRFLEALQFETSFEADVNGQTNNRIIAEW